MRLFTKSILGSAVILSVFFVSMPARAAALTSDQITAVTSLLQSFDVPSSTLNTVAAVLNHLPTSGQGDEHMSTSTPTLPGKPMAGMRCLSLDRNLGLGSQGNDVKSLQEMLKQDPGDGFTASTTGYFGPMTAKAMAYFQMHNGIASSTDGSVGPLTRAFFSRSCAGGLLGDRPSVGSHATSTSQAGRPMVMLINGTITANNTSSITLHIASGESWTINIIASTTIYVSAPPPTVTSTATSTPHTPPPPPTTGTVADLVVGKAVVAEGKSDGANTLDAATIRVGGMPPMMNTGGPMMGGQGEDH